MKEPDCYVLIKLTFKENTDNIQTGTIYKLFSTWYGGYLGSDKWRLNSGISNVKKENDYYLIYGHSDTVYKVYKNIGYSNYSYSIIQDLTENIPDYAEVEVISDVDKVVEVLESFMAL